MPYCNMYHRILDSDCAAAANAKGDLVSNASTHYGLSTLDPSQTRLKKRRDADGVD